MLSMKTKVYCIIYIVCTIFDITSQNEGLFENVAVKGGFSLEDRYLEYAELSSNESLSENPTSRRFVTIMGFMGPLTTLHKDSITDLPKLQLLRIYGKKLETIEPGAFKNLPNLKHVALIWCKIKTIQEGVFNDLQIVELDLRGDTISSIATRAFDNMTALEKITLSYNPLSHWDENWFYNTPRLIRLYALNNRFQELPKNAFKNFGGKNNVSITIRNNSLTTVGDDLFATPTNVTLLDLSDNKIENFGENVLNGVEIMDFMNLVGNKIHCFNGNLSRIFIAKEIQIGFNPLECGDCVKKLDDWGKIKNYGIIDWKQRVGEDC